jgi:hypothetical protein
VFEETLALLAERVRRSGAELVQQRQEVDGPPVLGEPAAPACRRTPLQQAGDR